MGSTVKAEPAPNPAAVNPAASPRRSGNHLRALSVAVPYTMPAPRPPAIPPTPTYNHARVLAHELVDWDDKERPSILQVGDGNHANNTDYQLQPSVVDKGRA